VVSAVQTPVSTNCAACGLVLKDLTDAQTALDLQCRAMYSYRMISSLDSIKRAELNGLIHAVAQNALRGDELRNAIFRMHELGFAELAKRVERRVWRATVEVVEAAPVPVPASPPTRPVLPFALTQGQEQAMAMGRRVMSSGGHACGIVAGYSGVGKTTIVKVFAHEFGTPLVITPTGKSALRVREATGLDARTIHRWIYKVVEDPKTGGVKFVRRNSEEIEKPASRLIVLDEASMVPAEIWRDVYSVCEQHDLRLICVGDAFQLPPVQERGAPPFSILSPEFAQELGAERVEMTEVTRQALDSPVIRASMALRGGRGLSALHELPHVDLSNFGHVAIETYKAGGVCICHRNATRFQLNAMFRVSLGIYDEMPQKGEPLMCRKNVYEADLVNGEAFPFTGWAAPPEQPERIYDKYKNVEEYARFGGTHVGESNKLATLAVEELHGRLGAGPRAVEIAASRWARAQSLYGGDSLAPHVHAQFGYCLTAHSSQGSEYPYVLVVIEPSVRADEEEGRRWIYTATTRSKIMTAVYIGRI